MELGQPHDPARGRRRLYVCTALTHAAFHIYHSGQGSQGILGQVSKQQLDNVFGTTKEDEAVVLVLERGHLQHGSTYGGTLTQKCATTTSRATTARVKLHLSLIHI